MTTDYRITGSPTGNVEGSKTSFHLKRVMVLEWTSVKVK